jgi:hypothetical protein
MSDLYVVLDIGCIECREETRVVSIYPDKEAAIESANRYARQKGADPLQESDPLQINLLETEYFEGGQHSIEIHAYTGAGNSS